MLCADSLHHQLCVDVPQDVGHGAAVCFPHYVSGMLVVLKVSAHNLYGEGKALEDGIGFEEGRFTEHLIRIIT
jgi:hypothetical protein